ncbi:alpha/beta hydrolase family protein [Amphritea balenae]|uniref:Alpha/beta hydrolase n=1 Tax=Amphritea balenae TaxID=452629 RepID=A0A3P1SIZ2_9GAMM|nr:dienelactone hydrolase family protein [Amphritea balenae]RRC97118.1 alpha/beta hydrolase [Amphritea balenae]GGK68133.1 dienelactone hydrolase [Amphritea balenae]
MKNIKLFTVAFAFSVLAGCSESTEVQKNNGEFYIGYEKVDVESKATGEQFSVALIYPSDTPSKQVNFGPFKMELSIGGKVAEGKFPLVVISHGSGGTNLGHRSIAFALVKSGFVVGMPLHPKNNYINNQFAGTVSNWKNRPQHISASIDAILSSRNVSESINAQKIAVVGHSTGGYTALAVAGGKADTSHIVDLCLSNSQINEPFCGLARENKTEKVKIENLRDERIKAIVMMAPVGILFNSADSLNKVDIPALLLRAERDTELTEPYQSEVIAKNYRNPKLLTYCTVPNAGHYSFITPFPEAMKNELGVVGEDPDGFDRRAFHETLSSDIVNFLDQTLNSEHNKKLQLTSCLDG